MIAPFCVDCEAPQRTHRQVLTTRCEKIDFGECTMRVCVQAIEPQCAGDKTKRRGPGGPALADSDRTKGCQRRGERFHPDEAGRERSLDDLSDGQRSLFHLAMTAATLNVEARIRRRPGRGRFPCRWRPASRADPDAVEEPENNLAPFYLSRRANREIYGEFYKNRAAAREIARQNAAKSVSCRTIPYKMKQGIYAGNLLRLAASSLWCEAAFARIALNEV
jgi:hypothetical protein